MSSPLDNTWEEIEAIYRLPHVNKSVVKNFKQLKNDQQVYSREEGVTSHLCSFFIPYDNKKGEIYLCNHIKAGGWIPTGGHLEEGESPRGAAVREMQEELGVRPSISNLTAFDLSATRVNHPPHCLIHYDVWHLVEISKQNFIYDTSEYYEAEWFSLEDAVNKLAPFPNFAAIIAKLPL